MLVEFKDKQKTKRFFYSKIVIFIIVVVIVTLIPGVYGIYIKGQESAKDRAAAERELADLKTREEMLSSRLNYVNTDRGLEEEIREKFNVAKQGESVIVLVDKPVVASTTENDANIFRAMWNKIKKVF